MRRDAVDVLRLPLADHRLQPRAPARQRLMRLGVARQHDEVLISAETVAQLLRLAHPASRRAWATAARPFPSDSDAPPRAGAGREAPGRWPPASHRESDGAPGDSASHSPLGHVRERQFRPAASARSALRRGPSPPISASRIAGVRLAVSADERRSSSLCADRLPGLRRQPVRWRVLLDVGHRVERGLRVARAGQHPGEVAGLGAPARSSAARMRLDQPQIGAPGLHRGAEIVHRHGLDALAVLHRSPALAQECGGRRPATRCRRRLAAASPVCQLMRQLYERH